jgi:type I restriction enzyme M protein
MARSGSSNRKTESGANIGFEAKLWLAADKLRSNMDAAEYKHVVLGLIFLKYISDSFEEHRRSPRPQIQERRGRAARQVVRR